MSGKTGIGLLVEGKDELVDRENGGGQDTRQKEVMERRLWGRGEG